MSARWLTVLLVLTAACGAMPDPAAGTEQSAQGAVTTDLAQGTAPTAAATGVAPSTEAAQVTTSTTLDPISQQVQLEVSLPPLDGPATLWRMPALPPDPERLARWGRAFGFTDEEVGAAIDDRIIRNTPDGQALSISESTGQWVFVDGPAGMFAIPGSCPLPAVAPPSTTIGATPATLPPGQLCADPRPLGIPDSATAEQLARSLWQALGIDLTGATVTVGGDDYLREVIASDDLGDVILPRLHVVIGVDGQVMRATGGIDAPVEAGSIPRLGVVEAVERFARQPPSAGPPDAYTAPPSWDGVYRVTRATTGLISEGDRWLVPSYDVTLADGRTLTLLAIDDADIPTS
jgi:hypothetical protein